MGQAIVTPVIAIQVAVHLIAAQVVHLIAAQVVEVNDAKGQAFSIIVFRLYI